VPYEYEPKIWDPQAATETINPVFSSPDDSLPLWLKWDEGKLIGTPTQIHDPAEIIVLAEVSRGPARLTIVHRYGRPKTITQYELHHYSDVAGSGTHDERHRSIWP
jgi:hypothetical protein